MPAATYRVQAPDGNTYQVDGPAGASDEEVRAEVLRQFPQAAGKKAEPAYDPTDGMSFLDKTAAGAGKAVVDLYRGGKQLLGVGDQADLQRTIDEEKRLSQPLMHTAGGVVGNLAGNVAALAIPGTALARGAAMIPGLATAVEAAMAARPIATAAALGAGSGAVQGALEPVATGESRGKNMAVGAGIGAAGGILPGALARVAKPNVSDDVALLMNEGVRLTPGQAMGGAAKAIEEKATSIPLIGSVIKRAQTRGIEDFNRAGFNRALAPIGEKVGPDFNIGREGVAAVERKIGDAYDQVLTKIKIVPLDDQFSQDIGKITGMTAELGQGPAQQFAAILKNRVLDKMTDAGTMSADTMKMVESELGRQASRWSGSADAAQRGLADAIREVQSALRANVERTAGPELAGELKAANTAWANFVRIQDAAGRQGARDGLFTAPQLSAAVRSQDKSVRKGAFARGDALMQDLSDAGKNVIAQTVPDSGTAGRLMNAGGIASLPFLDPTILATLAGVALPYSSMGGKVTLAALAKRPEFAGTLAEILRAGAPAGGIASGLMAPLLAGP